MPFKPGEREYRSFFGISATPNDGKKQPYEVQGYATTFDVPYEFGRDWDGNTVYEVIDRHALDGADMSDVIMQFDHAGQPMARQRNKTLEITLNDHGMLVRASLAGSQAGRDLYEAITNGLVDRMSWGFTVPKDGWEYDEETRTSKITRVDKVFDVSAVSRPADEDTEIHARSYLNGVIESEHLEQVRRKKDEQEREKLLLIMSINDL